MPRKRDPATDFRGQHVPLRLIKTFKNSKDLVGLLWRLQNCAQDLAKLEGLPGLELIDFEDFSNTVAYLRNMIDHWRPYMVCQDCAKKLIPDGTCACEGRGWLPLSRADARVRNKHIRRRLNREPVDGQRGGIPVALRNLKAKAKSRWLG